jgi:hypothetical protein
VPQKALLGCGVKMMKCVLFYFDMGRFILADPLRTVGQAEPTHAPKGQGIGG